MHAKSLLSLAVAASLSCLVPAVAYADTCEHDGEVTVTLAPIAVQRVPGDVLATVTLDAIPAPEDPEDPCEDEPCDDPEEPCEDEPCDDPEEPCEDEPCDDPEDPCEDEPCDDPEEPEEPFTVSVDVASGGAGVVVVPAGAYAVTASAPGFADVSVDVLACSDRTVDLVLLPDGSVALTASVLGTFDEEGASSAAGATLTLTGLDERVGLTFEGVVDEQGGVVIADVPAGFYALAVTLTRDDGSVERVALAQVDLLESSWLSLRLRSSGEFGEVSLSCSSSGAAAPWWFVLLLVPALAARRRSRRAA